MFLPPYGVIGKLSSQRSCFAFRQVVQKDACWVKWSKLLVVMQDRQIPWHTISSAEFIAYQVILAVFDHGGTIHAGLHIDWLLRQRLPTHVLDLGLSSELLYYIGRTTELAVNSDTHQLDALALLAKIKEAEQVVSGIEGKPREVVATIAESYKHAACILLHCRLFG